MKAYSRNLPGIVRYRTCNPYGCSTGTNFPPKKIVNFTVIGGETQGDFVNPTRFGYERSVDTLYTGYYVYSDGWRYGTYYDGVVASPIPTLPFNRVEWSAAARQKALNKLTDVVRGNLDLSIDAFQFRQTLALKRQVGKLLYSFYRDVINPTKPKTKRSGGRGRRQRRSRIGSALGNSSQAYLTWIYGVKPTLQSIHDLALSSFNHYSRKGVVFESTAKVQDGAPFSGAVTGIEMPTSFLGYYWGRARCKYALTLVIPDDTLTTAARLTSLNPVSIAWELMPWSFVLDWIVNVGGYIRDLETAMIYRSFFVRGHYTDTWLFVGEANMQTSVYVSSCSAQAKFERRGLDRVPLTGYPTPERPRVNFDLGSQRLLNAAALIGSKFFGR